MLNFKSLKYSKAVFQRVMLGLCMLSAITVPVFANNIKDQLNGLTLHSTRVVYPQDEKGGVTYTLTNNTPSAYLLQVRILPWDNDVAEHSEDKQGADEDENKTAFIALPPLQRFEAGETLTLRIRQKHNVLVQDRESIALLELTAIPAQSSETKKDNDGLVMAIQNNLKLFYRPTGLPVHSLEKIEQQLQFQKTQTGITIKNPTPFFITFNALSVGKTDLDLSQQRMIPPFGEQSWVMDADQANDVHWQLITDNGGSGEKATRQLTSK